MDSPDEEKSLIVRLPMPQTSIAPDRLAFNRRVDDVKVSKMDINYVIMDYLINEGYPVAAKKFAVEANIQQPAEAAEYIDERVSIRNAIFRGNIQSAIEQINDLDSDLLDHNSSLHFSLLRLQLIELIRPCVASPDADITPALVFAQNSLAPRAPTNPKFLEDLERTMALLIFPAENPPPMLVGLLDPEMRQEVATRVNEAILKGQGLRSQAKLKRLVKLRTWAEQKARDQGKTLPSNMDIWSQGNSEDTVMSHEADVEADIS